MIKKIDSAKMGKSRLGWLTSWFHFSFAEYYNPRNICYGALRVINDDLIQPGHGFDLHPHSDMELITYVVDGQLTHVDNMNHQVTLSRGEIQYMSAGTGVVHSEHNRGSCPLRLLQIWLFPDRDSYPPFYQHLQLKWEDRVNRWLPIVSGRAETAPIKIHQDAEIYVTELSEHRSIVFPLRPDRQAYLVQIEGESVVNGLVLERRDAMEVQGEALYISAVETSHLMLINLKR